MRTLLDKIVKITALNNLSVAEKKQFVHELSDLLKQQEQEQQTCLSFFVDKLCNDLSTFVMNAQRIKLKVPEIHTNPTAYIEYLDKVLLEIRYKGRLANERLKGVSYAILDQQNSFLEFDLLAIMHNMQELFEQEPTKVPIQFSITSDQQQLIVLGNKEQLTLVFHLLLFAFKGFTNSKNTAHFKVQCHIKTNPQSKLITFQFEIPIAYTQRLLELKEYQIAELIIVKNHGGNLNYEPSKEAVDPHFLLTIALPILA